jgi:hypothetical protein
MELRPQRNEKPRSAQIIILRPLTIPSTQVRYGTVRALTPATQPLASGCWRAFVGPSYIATYLRAVQPSPQPLRVTLFGSSVTAEKPQIGWTAVPPIPTCHRRDTGRSGRWARARRPRDVTGNTGWRSVEPFESLVTMSGVPPRDATDQYMTSMRPWGRQIDISFDVDLGELVRGHRVWLREELNSVAMAPLSTTSSFRASRPREP